MLNSFEKLANISNCGQDWLEIVPQVYATKCLGFLYLHVVTIYGENTSEIWETPAPRPVNSQGHSKNNRSQIDNRC